MGNTTLIFCAASIAMLSIPCVLSGPLGCSAADFSPHETIAVDGERDTRGWDKARWVDFIARRMSGDSSYRKTESPVMTPSGVVVDIFESRKIAWIVCYDHEWRSRAADVVLAASDLEAEPGVWLLVPDARRSHYIECRLYVQTLRSWGVPFHIRTLTIPERGDTDG